MRNAFTSVVIIVFCVLAAGCAPAASAADPLPPESQPPPASAPPEAAAPASPVQPTVLAVRTPDLPSPTASLPSRTPPPVAEVAPPPDDDFRYDTLSRVGATGRPQLVEFFTPT